MMGNKFRVLVAIIVFGLTIGQAFGEVTVTFDKNIDVPDKDFTPTYDGSTFSFTIDNLGNYKFGDDVKITVTGGTDDMRFVVWSADKLSGWHKTHYGTGGSISITIPKDKFDPGCSGLCNNGNMGPGIYALAVMDYDDTVRKYFTAKPFIISEYDLTITTNKTQAEANTSIKVTVLIKKDGNPVDVSNNVKVVFFQDPTYFNGSATKISTGTYEANVKIPKTVKGTHLLYAAITTNAYIYGDYPEIIGANSYNGNIQFTEAPSTSTPTATSSSSGGGGGGGGGATTGEPFENIETAEKREKSLRVGEPVSYTFTESEHAVSEIVITGENNENEVAIKVESLKGTSQIVSASPVGTVYKNLNIVASTKRISSALIHFNVENSWLASNNIDSVKMVRWDGSEWAQLDTAEITQDAKYTSYEAKTNGFSSFAIVGLKEEVMPTEVKATVKPTVITTPVDENNTHTQEATEEGNEMPGFGAMGFITAILLMVTIRNIRR